MKNVTSWIISLVAAAIVFFLAIGHVIFDESSKVQEIVILGDSNIGTVGNGKGISAYLEELLGRNVLNGGFGGACASYVFDQSYPAEVGSQLSLVRLANAIGTDDFSVQKSLIAYGDRYFEVTYQTLAYFEATITALDETDFSKVKYLIIEHGTNDYNNGILLENPADKYDVNTYAGGLRSSVEMIREAYPDLQIVFMTPNWCYITKDSAMLFCDEVDFGGGTLQEYVECMISIADEYGIPVLNNYRESGIDKSTADFYLSDGLHLNEDGQKLIADRLAALILELEKR